MLGFLGTLLFGATYTGAWIHDDNKEKERRQSAQENKRDFYTDKRGIMRHTSTGRKFTKEEVHERLFGGREEQREREEAEIKDRFDERYYAVKTPIPGDIFTYEVFLTEEEAIEYKNKCEAEGKKIRVGITKISRAYWESENRKCRYNLHF